MKRNILIIAALFCASILSAAPVSRTKAASLASRFCGSDISALTPVWEEKGDAKSALSSAEEPFFHAFNRQGGGWVIMAGDDLLSPVLGYSDEGSISGEMPSNMKVYFRHIKENLDRARKADMVPTAKQKARWASLSGERKASTGGKLLQTASWGQDSPFNDKCPKITGEKSRSVTGCVATAMAIVLRYHQWPAHGTGYLDSYKVGTTTVGGFSIDSHNYDWTLPLKYTSSWTTAQKTAAAQICFDLGVMVQMEYSCDGSGAMSENIIPALFSHMSYDGSALELSRSNYSNDEWFRMIKAEIDADRPIIYGGADYSTEEGHQFVCDGYDANDNIHINWGWDGSLNGYYAVCYIGDKKSSGVDDVFNWYDSGVFGLKKDESGTSKLGASLFMLSWSGYEGLAIKSGDPASGANFTIKVGYIANTSYTEDYNGKVRPVLVDRNGDFKAVIGSEKTLSVSHIANGSYSTSAVELTCKTDSFVLGDAIEVQFLNTDGNWCKLGAEKDPLAKVGSSLASSAIGVYDISYIRLPEKMHSGQTLYFELVPGHKVISGIVWYFKGSKMNDPYATLTSGKQSLQAEVTYSDGTKEKISANLNVTE